MRAYFANDGLPSEGMPSYLPALPSLKQHVCVHNHKQQSSHYNEAKKTKGRKTILYRTMHAHTFSTKSLNIQELLKISGTRFSLPPPPPVRQEEHF